MKVIRMSTSVMIVRLLICSVIFVLPYCRGFKDEHIIDSSEQGLAINSTNWYLKLNISDINGEIQKATEKIENRYRLEDTILSNISQITIGSPVHGQLIDSMPSKDGNSESQFAEIIIEVTRSLKNTYCLKHGLSDIQCAKDLTKVNLTGTTLDEMCRSEYYNSPCKRPKYRNTDGSCNNSKRKNWGKANTPYKRLLFPAYTDGISEMPSKEKLPNPRSLSLNLVKDEISIDQRKTMMVPYWLIFIAHDLSHTAVSTTGKDNRFVDCCEKDKNIQYTLNKNMRSCKPIPIPEDDKFFKPEPHDCMNYVRSRPAVRSDCTFGPMEQMNQATHFLDGSMIYGSSTEQELSLREMSFGRLIEIDRYRYDPESSSMPRETTDTNACQNGIGTCFKAGDIRENAFPQLAALHTLWIKEHNRLALEVLQSKPTWNDLELFYETKRIVIGLIQHITYNEFLPALLGSKFVNESGLEVTNAWFHDKKTHYDDNLDPTVSNVFATTILPVAYSMISNIIRLNREDSNSEEFSGWSYDNLTLKEYYNRPVDALKNNTHYILKGLTTENAQNVDMLFTQTITNYLYSIDTNNSFGMDMLSLDIQRSRDHGIPSYTQFRKYCGLKDIENEQDLSDIMGEGSADILLKQYKTWNDIDLLVGVLMEKHAEDAMVGPTMRCIIGEQFLRTKKADVYFYDGRYEFKTTQIFRYIKYFTLGNILCKNEYTKMNQKNVFLKSKELESCFPKYNRDYFRFFYGDSGYLGYFY